MSKLYYRDGEFLPDGGELSGMVVDDRVYDELRPSGINVARDYSIGDFDWQDLHEISRRLIWARQALVINTRQLEQALRDLSVAEQEFAVSCSRERLFVSGGTQSEREAVVACKTFGLSERVRVCKGVVGVLKNEGRMIRDDINVLVAMSSNARSLVPKS